MSDLYTVSREKYLSNRNEIYVNPTNDDITSTLKCCILCPWVRAS